MTMSRASRSTLEFRSIGRGKPLRSGLALLAILSFAALAPTADAIEFSILGPDSIVVGPGEAFTIDIALDNASMTSNNGVLGTLSGLAAAGAVVESGRAVRSFFVALCIADFGCFSGNEASHASFWQPEDVTSLYTPGDDSIQIISGLRLSAETYDGSADPGLDGAIDEPSPRDVTLTLMASVLGTHVLTVGGNFSSGGNQPITETATFTVTVIPEPTTAALLGLGLAALAGVGKGSLRRPS